MSEVLAYAHTVQGLPEESWQKFDDHLQAVALLAADFSNAFGAEEWGRLAVAPHAGAWIEVGAVWVFPYKPLGPFCRATPGFANSMRYTLAGFYKIGQQSPAGRTCAGKVCHFKTKVM